MKPFIKWAGGKQRLIPHLPLPPTFTKYIEPFLGGGAMYYNIRTLYPDVECWLSDINLELLNCYWVVRDNVRELITALEGHAYNHSIAYYMIIRNSKPTDPVASAARFIYLNKTGFNGLYRVNKKGEFNVPVGRYQNPTICDKFGLLDASAILRQKTVIMSRDFRYVTANDGDFIYLDPPYHQAQFTQYHQSGFADDDHRALAELCTKWAGCGAYVMVSNSDTDFVRELYQGWKVKEVQVSRAINSNPQGRQPVTELVITNY